MSKIFDNKIKLKVVTIISLMFVFLNFTYAASYTATSSNTTLEIGGTANIVIKASDLAGRFNISSSNSAVVSINSSSQFLDNNSATIVATAKAVGTAVINIVPAADNVADSNGNDVSKTVGSKSITITVKEKATANNNTNTNNNNTNNNSSNNSNANLKRLVPNYEGLSPNFSSNVTKYSLSVPENATSVKFTAVPEVTGAKYWITGDENLKLGDNTVTITVTAKDGTKKSYTVIVTRAADANKANAYLNNIIVDGNELNPVFAAENLEYTLKDISGEVEKLNILAYAKSEKAKIEIIGNEKLIAGENNIKILVTAEDGSTTKEYILKVKKEEVSVNPTISNETGNENVNIYDEVNAYKNTDNGGKLSRILGAIRANLLVIILYIFVLVEFAQIMYLYKKVNKIDNINKSDDIISDESFMTKEETLENMDKLDTNFEKTETPTKRRR